MTDVSEKLRLQQTILSLEGRIAEAKRKQLKGWEETVSNLAARLCEAKQQYKCVVDQDGINATLTFSTDMFPQQQQTVSYQFNSLRQPQQGVLLPEDQRMLTR